MDLHAFGNTSEWWLICESWINWLIKKNHSTKSVFFEGFCALFWFPLTVVCKVAKTFFMIIIFFGFFRKKTKHICFCYNFLKNIWTAVIQHRCNTLTKMFWKWAVHSFHCKPGITVLDSDHCCIYALYPPAYNLLPPVCGSVCLWIQ